MVDIPKIDDSLLVLNQTNALTISPFSKERKLLAQGTLWHKIIIHNVANVDRELVLKALLNVVHPLDLIPVNYKIEGKNAHFIARNCGQAIEKLCRDNLVVQNPKGQPYIVTIILGYSNTAETQLNVQNNISDAIKKRYDSKSGTIDLDSFHKDPALSELIFCVLSQPKILHFVLQLCKPLQPKIIKLGNNELRTVSPMEVLWSCKSLTYLDLRCNLIENMVSLGALKSMQIKELWLDGNPVCQNYDETGYLQAVREICPTIIKLDGVLLGTEGFLAYRRNFSVVHNSESFIDQFLEHFFSLYDSVDRGCLKGLYHKNAIFSLSCSYISGQITSLSSRLDSYKRTSRNLLKLVDLSKTNEYLEIGPDDIIKKLCILPTTEHDPYTFTVDVLEYTDERVTLTVTGAFREPMENLRDIECLYCFCRTFILVAGKNGEYNIINEMLHVSNATTILANRAFKMVKISKPRALTSLKNAQNDPEKDEFIFCLSRVTALNYEWSKRCLVEAKWDLKRALEIFVDFYKLDKIPQDAFLSEEVLNKMMEIRLMNEIERMNQISNDIPKGFTVETWNALSNSQRKKLRKEEQESLQLEEHMSRSELVTDMMCSPYPPRSASAAPRTRRSPSPGVNVIDLTSETDCVGDAAQIPSWSEVSLQPRDQAQEVEVGADEEPPQSEPPVSAGTSSQPPPPPPAPVVQQPLNYAEFLQSLRPSGANPYRPLRYRLPNGRRVTIPAMRRPTPPREVAPDEEQPPPPPPAPGVQQPLNYAEWLQSLRPSGANPYRSLRHRLPNGRRVTIPAMRRPTPLREAAPDEEQPPPPPPAPVVQQPLNYAEWLQSLRPSGADPYRSRRYRLPDGRRITIPAMRRPTPLREVVPNEEQPPPPAPVVQQPLNYAEWLQSLRPRGVDPYRSRRYRLPNGRRITIPAMRRPTPPLEVAPDEEQPPPPPPAPVVQQPLNYAEWLQSLRPRGVDPYRSRRYRLPNGRRITIPAMRRPTPPLEVAPDEEQPPPPPPAPVVQQPLNYAEWLQSLRPRGVDPYRSRRYRLPNGRRITIPAMRRPTPPLEVAPDEEQPPPPPPAPVVQQPLNYAEWLQSLRPRGVDPYRSRRYRLPNGRRITIPAMRRPTPPLEVAPDEEQPPPPPPAPVVQQPLNYAKWLQSLRPRGVDPYRPRRYRLPNGRRITISAMRRPTPPLEVAPDEEQPPPPAPVVQQPLNYAEWLQSLRPSWTNPYRSLRYRLPNGRCVNIPAMRRPTPPPTPVV